MKTAALAPAHTTPSRPRGPVTVSQHLKLYSLLDELIQAKKKKPGYKGPRSRSQFFERETIRIIREEGPKHDIKLPAEFVRK